MKLENIMSTIYVITFLIVLPGCVTASGVSSYSNQKPIPNNVQNSVLVDESFDEIWDKLVKELVTKFYVINNIDKESRLLNVSFTTDNPEQYVTGGTSYRELRRGDEIKSFSCDPAESSTYEYDYKWGPYKNLPGTAIIYRHASLQGRANIYVAPQDNGSIVTVNSRYVLTVNTSGTATEKNAFGTVLRTGPIPQSNSATASFNTNAPTTVNWGTPQESSFITFQTRGTFEDDVLSITK